MTVAEAIASGALPRCLEGGDWRDYVDVPKEFTFASMWGAIAWVRAQAFWRDADAEADAVDWADWEWTTA